MFVQEVLLLADSSMMLLMSAGFAPQDKMRSVHREDVVMEELVYNWTRTDAVMLPVWEDVLAALRSQLLKHSGQRQRLLGNFALFQH